MSNVIRASKSSFCSTNCNSVAEGAKLSDAAEHMCEVRSTIPDRLLTKSLHIGADFLLLFVAVSICVSNAGCFLPIRRLIDCLKPGRIVYYSDGRE